MGAMSNLPNILIFMTDQQRADTCHGSNYCKTPNIDAFKAEGIDFKQAFCPSPHCFLWIDPWSG